MTEFDEFCSSLLEEAKRFLEKAIAASAEEAKVAYRHSAILLGISSLEAYVNGIAEELIAWKDIPLNEKSLLVEKEIELKNGVFRLSAKLRRFRLTDRIEYLYRKFKRSALKNNDEPWWPDLKSSISLRNKLVHPKANLEIDEKQVKMLLQSVIDCLTSLSKAVYNKEFPFKNLGLQSKMTY